MKIEGRWLDTPKTFEEIAELTLLLSINGIWSYNLPRQFTDALNDGTLNTSKVLLSESLVTSNSLVANIVVTPNQRIKTGRGIQLPNENLELRMRHNDSSNIANINIVPKYPYPTKITFDEDFTSLNEAEVCIRDIVDGLHLHFQDIMKIINSLEGIYLPVTNVVTEDGFVDVYIDSELVTRNTLKPKNKTVQFNLADIILSQSNTWYLKCVTGDYREKNEHKGFSNIQESGIYPASLISSTQLNSKSELKKDLEVKKSLLFNL